MANAINGGGSGPLLVKVEARNVFGNTLFYPANEVSEMFCTISGRETLSRHHLDRLQASEFYTVESTAAVARHWGS